MSLVLRSLLFTLCFYGLTAMCSILYLPGLLLPSRKFMKLVRLWTRLCVWCAAAIAGIRYQVRGREHLPDGPAVFAVKHQSVWETLALTLLIPDSVFVLKQELLRIPLFGWYLRKARNIAIDRKAGAQALTQVIRQAQAVLDDGRSVLIFPEGTRAPAGKRDHPYHPGVAGLYGLLDAPVIPVALNSGLFWPRHRLMKRPGLVTVEYLPAMPPGLKRREFMRLLRERIEGAAERLEQEAGVAS